MCPMGCLRLGDTKEQKKIRLEFELYLDDKSIETNLLVKIKQQNAIKEKNLRIKTVQKVSKLLPCLNWLSCPQELGSTEKALAAFQST